MGKNEIRQVLRIIFVFLLAIEFSAWNDNHYACRIKIPKWLYKLFFNHVKHGTVPLLSFVTFVQFYLSLIILTIIKLIDNGVNLGNLLYYYLLIPWAIVGLITFIIDAIIGYKKRRVQKELNVKNNVINQKFKKKNKVNRKFKKRGNP